MIQTQAGSSGAAPTRLWFALLCLNGALALSAVALWVQAARAGLFWRADFTQFYTGWALARAGAGAGIYDFARQAQAQQALLGGRSFQDGLLPYVYPPYATPPFMPLAWLPLQVAFFAWALVQLGLLVWLVQLLRRLAATWRPQERWLLITATLAFPPLLITFMMGTLSLLLLVATLHLYQWLKAGRESAAGVSLALLAFKPQLVVLPGLALLCGRRWRALGASALVLAALSLLATLVLGWRSWPAYLALLRRAYALFGSFGFYPERMYNLKGLLTSLLGYAHGPLINTLSTLGFLAGAAAVAWLWRGPWQPTAPHFEPRLALTLTLGLLLSPHLYRHDTLLFVAPVVLTLIALRRDPQRWPHGLLFACCPLVFVVTDLTLGDALGIWVPTLLFGLLAAYQWHHLSRLSST